MMETMTAPVIKPYLRVYTGGDMYYRYDDEAEEWYEARDVRYFDRYDYQDESEEEETQETLEETAQNSQETVSQAVSDNTQTQTQTQTEAQPEPQYDLSYYGYGDFDFGQLSRTTTAFNIHDFMDPNPLSPIDDRANEGDDEGEEEEGYEEEDDDDADDMANRRWNCPQPQR